MASVKWSSLAIDNLEQLDPLIRERVLTKVSWFEENFAQVVPEKLHRELRGLYKLRIGDYRVVYSVVKDVLIIEWVGHRREVYR